MAPRLLIGWLFALLAALVWGLNLRRVYRSYTRGSGRSSAPVVGGLLAAVAFTLLTQRQNVLWLWAALIAAVVVDFALVFLFASLMKRLVPDWRDRQKRAHA